MMRIVDSHVHVWRIGAPGHAWPDVEWPALHRDFLVDDLRAAAAGIDLAGAILVQAQPDDRETDWMLTLAADDPLVRGVVGWVDLAAPSAPARIAALARHAKLRGVRPMLQGMAETDWILRPELDPAIDAMIAHHLSLDALIEPRHLSVIRTLAQRRPTLRIVVDHGAKPPAARNLLDPWREDIAALAALPGIFCKLSGLRTEQSPGQPAAQLAPYVAHLVATFGDRLMWGSDWPVLLHAGDSYAGWIDMALGLSGLDGVAAEQLFAGAARHFYRLDVASDGSSL
jgi:L-fuconolactonase